MYIEEVLFLSCRWCTSNWSYGYQPYWWFAPCSRYLRVLKKLEVLKEYNVIYSHCLNYVLGLGLRHRFDTEQPTLLDLELVNNRDRPSASSSTGGTTARTNVNSSQDRDNSNTITHPSIRYQFTLYTRTHKINVVLVINTGLKIKCLKRYIYYIFYNSLHMYGQHMYFIRYLWRAIMIYSTKY